MHSTRLPANAVPWSTCGYYYDSSCESEDIYRFAALSTEKHNSDGPTASSKPPTVRKSRSTTPKGKGFRACHRSYFLNILLINFVVRAGNDDYITPAAVLPGAAATSRSRLQHISPHDNLMQIVHPDVDTPQNSRRPQEHGHSRRKRFSSSEQGIVEHDTDSISVFAYRDEETRPKEVKTLSLGPARKVQRILEADSCRASLQIKVLDDKVIAFNSLREKYQSACLKISRVPHPPNESSDSYKQVVACIQKILLDQEKIAIQFSDEVVRYHHALLISTEEISKKRQNASKYLHCLREKYRIIAVMIHILKIIFPVGCNVLDIG